MAKAARIDEITKRADGSIEMKYTEGDVPLPLGWQGNALVFPDAEAFAQRLQESEDATAEHLKMLQAAVGYKSDSLIGATFRSKTVGRTATLDLTGQTSTVSLG